MSKKITLKVEGDCGEEISFEIPDEINDAINKQVEEGKGTRSEIFEKMLSEKFDAIAKKLGIDYR